jgi:hypothetical protein
MPSLRDIPVAVEVEAAAVVPRAETPEVVAVTAEETVPVPVSGSNAAKGQPLLSGLFDRPENLRDALIWREILSPPRCRQNGLPGL